MTKRTQASGYEQLSPAEKIEFDKDRIIGQFMQFAEEGCDELVRYISHCGITSEDIDRAGNWLDAVLRHYLTAGGYDLERAAQDLPRWPPVAARLRELKQEDQNRKERHAAQERIGSKRRKAVNGAVRRRQVPN
jgi:hypothetical protein